MVFLVGIDLGRVEKALRGPRSVSVESRADGSERFAGFARTGAMVLSPQWNDESVAVHAQHRLVRRESEGMAAAKRRGRGSKDFGIIDDRVRLAIAHAALREGKKVADWNVCAEIGATAAGKIDKKKLLEAAKSSAVEKRLRASTAEFHAMQITQRPAFVIDTEIGDRAIFSGVIKLEPIAATIDSMIADATFYAAHKAHFGDPPPK